jgi:hypothetical protein
MVEDNPDLSQKVIDVAKAEARGRGWAWLEPVHMAVVRVTPLGRVWEVRTNSQNRGVNVRIQVSDWDLAVVQAGHLPR